MYSCMITQILAHPQRLRRCAGLDFDQFQALALRLQPLWEEEEIARLTSRPRKNLIGQGHPYTLKTIDEKLLTVLMYYKLYPAYWFLGLAAGLDAGNICRLMAKMRKIIEKGADSSLDRSLKSALDKLFTEFEEKKRLKKKVSSWEQLKREDPNLYQIWTEVFVDATEQQRLRPGRKNGRKIQKRIQRRSYSGKKKRPTLKTQIMVNHQGRILAVSQTYPGFSP